MVSSIPITEIVKLIENVPSYVIDASNKLKFTSGFIVSLGFNKPDIPKHLWFYIYDNDIPVARVYSPSIKSKNNVPPNCSSLQAEIYIDFKDYSNISFNKLLNDTINKLIDMKLFKKKDLIVKDIRFIKYANVIFNHVFIRIEKLF